MSDTNDSPQIAFDPHYEWQGEHYEWQGSQPRSIQDNINPSASALSSRLRVWGNMFPVFALLSPGLLLLVLHALNAVPHPNPLLWLAFGGIWTTLGLGGLCLTLVGHKDQLRRMRNQGAFGLTVLATILLLLCLYIYIL